MPFVNGKFYANLLYGRALERARAANEGRVWSEESPESELLAAHPNQSKSTAKHQPTTSPKHHGDNYDPATTPEGVGNQIYNETAGLRPTSKAGTGPGTDWDMQQARKAVAHVIQNRAAAKIPGGLASDRIDPHEARAIGTIASPAYDAHGGSQAAAHEAAYDTHALHDPTGGALHFYLDDPKKKPPRWVSNSTPVAEFGPFENASGHGDVSRREPIRIKILKEAP